MNNTIRVTSYSTDSGIYFSNGRSIHYEHYQDCCENNYADFDQLKDTGIENRGV